MWGIAGRRWLSAAAVKADVKLLARLRRETDAAMSKCKDALAACNNDYDAALEWLRQSELAVGQAKAAKLRDRDAGQGAVGARVNAARSMGALWEMHCETDFVARNSLFVDFGADAADRALAHTGDLAALTQEVQAALPAIIGKLGENIRFRRVARLGGSGIIGAYTHSLGGDARAGRIAALVQVDGPGLVSAPNAASELGSTLDQIAQHISAMAAQPVTADGALLELAKQQFIFDPSATLQQGTHALLTVGGARTHAPTSGSD